MAATADHAGCSYYPSCGDSVQDCKACGDTFFANGTSVCGSGGQPVVPAIIPASAKQPIAMPMAVRVIKTKPAAATSNRGYTRRENCWVADAITYFLKISSAMTAQVVATV